MHLTTTQSAQLMRVPVKTVERLIDSGLIRGAAATGRQVFPIEAAQALAARSLAPLAALPGPEIPVLRVGVAKPADENDDREWIGYSTALSHDQLRLALSGWWRCDPERVSAAEFLPVTLRGFVVAVLTGLSDPLSDGGGRYARYNFPQARLAGYVLDLGNPVNATTTDPEDTAGLTYVPMLLGARLPSQSGGPIAYVPTGPAAGTASPAEGEA